ncbi:MAG: hypothetical protein JWO36_5857 [Myxococcales bacterium]|nr:hypothetical protein [Myxococcales bacterium]
MSEQRFPLPESPLILDAVWRALDLELPRSRKPNGRRFLKGERPLSDGARAALLRAMVRTLIEAGYVPVAKDDRFEPVELLTAAVEIWIHRWDHLVGHARALEKPNATGAALRYLRLAVADMAIRCAAFDELFRCPPPPLAFDDGTTESPTWARDGGAKTHLRTLPKALGVTRDRIHPGKTKDDWFDGRSRPSSDSVERFARSLAAHDRTKTADVVWLLYLRWFFALGDLSDCIARIIGRDAMLDLASSLRRLRSRARHVLAWIASEHRDAGLAEIVILGTQAPCAGPLVDELVRVEAPTHYGWAIDLRASRAPWIVSELSALVPREPELPDEIPDELIARLLPLMKPGRERELAEACCEHPAAYRWAVRMVVQQSFVRGRFDSAARMVGTIADATQASHHRMEASLVHLAAGNVDEAIRQLRSIRVVGAEADDVATAIAVIQAFAGQSDDALARFEWIAPRPTAFDFAYGVALGGAGRIAEALAVFERVIERVPAHALALEQAARCCDMLGRSIDANRYAKRASRLGRTVVKQRRARVRRDC